MKATHAKTIHEAISTIQSICRGWGFEGGNAIKLQIVFEAKQNTHGYFGLGKDATRLGYVYHYNSDGSSVFTITNQKDGEKQLVYIKEGIAYNGWIAPIKRKGVENITKRDDVDWEHFTSEKPKEPAPALSLFTKPKELSNDFTIHATNPVEVHGKSFYMATKRLDITRYFIGSCNNIDTKAWINTKGDLCFLVSKEGYEHGNCTPSNKEAFFGQRIDGNGRKCTTAGSKTRTHCEQPALATFALKPQIKPVVELVANFGTKQRVGFFEGVATALSALELGFCDFAVACFGLANINRALGIAKELAKGEYDVFFGLDNDHKIEASTFDALKRATDYSDKLASTRLALRALKDFEGLLGKESGQKQYYKLFKLVFYAKSLGVDVILSPCVYGRQKSDFSDLYLFKLSEQEEREKARKKGA